ncbi:ATP-grasp domain-containing protein [Verrucomicrobiota bacterium sgz303538]
MHLLYPSDPLKTRQADEYYGAEYEAVRSAGFSTSVFSLEEFQCGSFRAFPAIPVDVKVLYRGWMLGAADYESLVQAIRKVGAQPFTDLSSYLGAHHLPNWCPLLKDLTPETRVYPLDCDLEAELRSLSWSEYFIKDYVKSLKTSAGSRISKPEQVGTVVAEMRRFRGTIEGDFFCVRRVEEFIPETEQRFFVINSVAQSASGEIPSIVHECATRIASRFFSVDVVRRRGGELRVVEVGDGQVSDLVGWPPEAFAAVLKDRFSG